MADNIENCPRSVAVPISVTANTSGTVPSATKLHSASATHSGFTKISEFTLTAKLTGENISMEDYFSPKLSNTTAVWDFGDGYSLSGTNNITTKHTYKVPGIYTVSMYFYDGDGNAHINTFTESLSIYNYTTTGVRIDTTKTPGLTSTDSGAQIPASSKDNSFKIGVSASWQDIPTPVSSLSASGDYTLYVTQSGSKAKPYDTKNKYAHLIPYNAFYNNIDGNLIKSDSGLQFKLNNHWYVLSGSEIVSIAASTVDYFKDNDYNPILLGASTDAVTGRSMISIVNSVTTLEGQNVDTIIPPPHITYYDDIPNIDTGVRLLFKLDTSKHKIKNFYVDGIDNDINSSERSFLESNSVGYYSTSADNTTIEGYHVKITNPAADHLSFTSTGMKEMSAISYKRQGDKFQVFIAIADKDSNILKLYPNFLKKSTLNVDYSFYTTWSSGDDLHTSVISSISTNKFPYNTSTNVTELSSFLYLNVDPLSSGTWTLNITGNVPGLSTQDAFGGCIGSGNIGSGSTGEASTNYITGSYTFTVLPSTNDVEVYKINEDIDYSQTIKSYRFQSFLHEYDNLFDGIFTSFVGEASSSPTVFGKTVFEKIANFVANNNDVDYCNMDNLQSFYDLFNEDIDIVLPTPPPELKRLYDLFSIKITKMLGDYERQEQSFNSNFYTSSADSRNIDFNNKITSSTYTVSAYTNFVARQKFNNEFILIKPQNVASTQVYDERNTVNPVLLIRGNVGSGSSFSDSSTSTTTHTMTANRNATHSTTQSKFNGGSIKFDGDDNNANADYIKLDAHDDFVFGTDDFTIDCWMYGDSFADYEAVFSHGCKTNNNMLHALEVTADAAVRWLIRATGTGGTETIDMRTPNGTISTDTWHHIAAVRSGAYFYIFIDGVLQAKSDEDAQPWPINTGSNQGGYTTRSSTGNYWYDPANGPADLVELVSTGGDKKPVYIGARVRNPSSNIDGMHGYLDEFRITRTALWTSDFTPPATRGGASADSSYPLSSYNVYSNWGWPLDTSVSGASGLDGFYDFYPYTTYATTSSNENIKNSIIDFNNEYTTVTRSTSSLSANWENTGGVIYKNLDYQIRKGLSI